MQPRHYQTARLLNLRYRGWLRSSTYMSTRLLRASTKIHLLHGHVWNHAHQQQTKLKKLPDFFFLFCVEFNETGNAKSGLRQLRFQVSDPVAGFGRTLVEAAKVKKNSVVPRQHVFTTEQISGILQTLEKRKKTSLTFHRKKLNVLLTVG